MVELANRAVEAAWKIRNLEDYDARLERAARSVDELAREHETAALVIYEAALARSGRPQEEVRETVRRFRDTFEDEEEPLTIPRLSALLNVEDDSWFFGDESLRVLTGRLLGQFQHRVAQYNYVDEREVLRRWADGYDTRLFIRRRILETEPVVGVVGAFDLRLLQYLRLISGGNTLVPSENVARALEALGYGAAADDYEVLARAEELAMHLELPGPVVGEMLEELAREGRTDFPEPPREATEPGEPPEEDGEEDSSEEGVASEGGEVKGGAAAEAREEKPSPGDRGARSATGEDPGRGEEPTRVQDPQAKDAPGVDQETGDRKDPDTPETGRGGTPGASDREDGD
ncbi:MAG TPA: hypothetical protein VHH10_10130 [Rubrobacteraceae bacterium]|nr:hypothetical protein [Rubrobacteraceae bacterium]